MQVTGSLVCSQNGVDGCATAICGCLRSKQSKFSVAVDPVGASPGNWCHLQCVSRTLASGNPTPDRLTISDQSLISGNQMAEFPLPRSQIRPAMSLPDPWPPHRSRQPSFQRSCHSRLRRSSQAKSPAGGHGENGSRPRLSEDSSSSSDSGSGKHPGAANPTTPSPSTSNRHGLSTYGIRSGMIKTPRDLSPPHRGGCAIPSRRSHPVCPANSWA